MTVEMAHDQAYDARPAAAPGPHRSVVARLAGLRQQVLALVLLTLCPLLAFYAFELHSDYRRAIDMAVGHARVLATGLARQQMRIVEDTEALLHVLAAAPDIAVVDGGACTARLAAARSNSPSYALLGVAQADGRFICSDRGVYTGVDVSDRRYFQRALEERRFVVGEFIIGRLTGAPAVAVALPILTADGAVQHMVLAGIDARWIAEAVAGSGLPSGASLTIVDPDGHVLLRLNSPVDRTQAWSVGQRAGIDPMPDGRGRYGTDLDGVERFLVSTSVTFGGDPVRIMVGFPTEDLVGSFWVSAAGRTAVLGLVILIMAVALHRWVARQVTQPVHALVERVESLRDGAGTAPPLAEYPRGEIGTLARRFDEMAALIDVRTRDLEDTNAELHVASQKAEAARLAAHAANHTKSEFLATMSHEVRTPLTAILGFAELLRDGPAPAGQEATGEYVGYILEAGTHLRDLISDLVDLTRIDTEQLTIDPVEIHLPSTLRSLVRMVEERAVRRGLPITSDLRGDLPILHADLRMVRQMVLNLLTNAVKYTPAGGSIHVSAVQDDHGRILITVADTGIGMAPEDIPRALEPYERLVDPTVTNGPEGIGLGLALVKRMVELHDGAIRIDSAPGRGTRATLVFPSETAPAD